MTTYTITRHDGEFISCGNSAEDVLIASLNHDGGEYEVRQDVESPEFFNLFHKSLNAKTMTACVGWTGYAGVMTADANQAWPLLVVKAIASGLPGAGITFMTDADYEAKMAQAEAENA